MERHTYFKRKWHGSFVPSSVSSWRNYLIYAQISPFACSNPRFAPVSTVLLLFHLSCSSLKFYDAEERLPVPNFGFLRTLHCHVRETKANSHLQCPRRVLRRFQEPAHYSNSPLSKYICYWLIALSSWRFRLEWLLACTAWPTTPIWEPYMFSGPNCSLASDAYGF